MGLLREILWSLWVMTLPVTVFSAVLVWWSMSRGHLKGEGGGDDLGREIKAIAAARKQRRKDEKAARKQRRKGGADGTGGAAAVSPPAAESTRPDPVYEKWMKFGGGFYGVIAFYTYLVIEWRDLVSFVTDFGGLWQMLRNINVGALVGLVVEAFMNFALAIAWPLYWLSNLPGRQPWLLFFAAYLGYWLGIRLAQRVAGQDWLPDWPRLRGGDGADD